MMANVEKTAHEVNETKPEAKDDDHDNEVKQQSNTTDHQETLNNDIHAWRRTEPSTEKRNPGLYRQLSQGMNTKIRLLI